MAGNGWKWLKLVEMPENGWKLVEMAGMAGND